MRKTFLEKVKEGAPLLSDGAWGTMLQEKGLQAGECPEAWNLEQPEKVYEVAKAYIDAGSDTVLTNSFGGSRFKLQHFGLESKIAEINCAAAELSRKAAGNENYVLGSIGPTGKMLIMGDVTEDELYDSFKAQVINLEHGGADAFVIETMSALDEAGIAVKAAKENSKLPVICTMTFEATLDGFYKTMMGVSPKDMLDYMSQAGVDIIGANCGNGIKQMIPIVKELRTLNRDIPILIHANAGMPVIKNGKNVFPETPEEMCAFIPQLIEAGANIIGGCCGTSPEHISAMRKIL